MAAATANASGNIGGIVNIQTIIDQIASVNKGLEQIVDAIQSSTNSVIMSIKVKVAKKKLKKSTRLLGELIQVAADAVNELMNNVKPDQLRTDLSKLVSNPASFSKDVTSGKSKVTNLSDNNAGILELIIGMCAAIKLICDIKIPSAIKIKLKMFKIKRALKSIFSGLESIQNAVDKVKLEPMEKALSKLVADPGAMMTAVYNPSSFKINGKKKGVLEYLLGVACIVHLVGEMKIPNPITILIKMLMLRMSLWMLTKNIDSLIESTKTLADKGPELQANDSGVKIATEAISNISDRIRSVCKKIMKLALAAAGTLIFLPMAMMGLLGIVVGIRGMMMILKLLGSPAMYAKVNITMRGVNRVLRSILYAVRKIAYVIALIAIVILMCVMIGKILPKMFGAFVIGLVVMIAMFGVMRLMFWIMKKIAHKAAFQATQLCINMLLICVVMIAITLVFMMLALVAKMAKGNMLEIAILCGLMIVVLFAMLGFMAVAGMVAPAVEMGVIAVFAVMVGILCLVLLVGLFWLLSLVAQELDVAAVEEAIQKVVDCVACVIRELIEADFKGNSKEQDAGLIGNMLGWVNPDLKAAYILITKVAILFVALFATAIMYLLALMMVEIVELYNDKGSEIDKAPENCKKVIIVAMKVIATLINTKPVPLNNGPEDGALTNFAAWMLGDDVVTIVRLVFKVIMVAIAMFALMLIKFLAEEMLWVSEFYTKNVDAIAAAPANCALVIAYAMLCIDAIININPSPLDKDQADGILIKFAGWVLGDDIVVIIRLIFKVITIAMAMFALLLIKFLAEEMLWLAKNVGDVQGAVTATNNVLLAADQVIDIIINGPQDDQNGSCGFVTALKKLLHWLNLDAIVDFIQLLWKFPTIGITIGALYVLLALAKTMKEMYDIYIKMGGGNIVTNMKNMTSNLIKGANAIIDTMKNESIDFGEKTASYMDDPLAAGTYDLLNAIAPGLTGAIDLFEQVEDLNRALKAVSHARVLAQLMASAQKVISDYVKNAKGLPDTVTELIKTTSTTAGIINGMKLTDTDKLLRNCTNLIKTLTLISVTFNKILDVKGNKTLFKELLHKTAQYGKVVLDTEKLINKVKTIDLDKMNALAKMFGNAAAFSNSINGNFDKLAEVVRDEIQPLMKGLHEIIKQADATIKRCTKEIVKSNKQAEDAAHRIEQLRIEEEQRRAKAKEEQEKNKTNEQNSDKKPGLGGNPVANAIDAVKKFVGHSEGMNDDYKNQGFIWVKIAPNGK